MDRIPEDDPAASAGVTIAAEAATENSIAGPVLAAVVIAVAEALASFFDR